MIKILEHFGKSPLAYGHRGNNETKTTKIIERLITLLIQKTLWALRALRHSGT